MLQTCTRTAVLLLCGYMDTSKAMDSDRQHTCHGVTLCLQGMRMLDNACEISIDRAEQPVEIWKTLEKYALPPSPLTVHRASLPAHLAFASTEAISYHVNAQACNTVS